MNIIGKWYQITCKISFISHIVYYKFLSIVNISCQPPPGYYPNNTDIGYQGSHVPSYGSTAIIVPEIILVGGCPACRVCIGFLLFKCYIFVYIYYKVKKNYI